MNFTVFEHNKPIATFTYDRDGLDKAECFASERRDTYKTRCEVWKMENSTDKHTFVSSFN